MAAGFGGAAFTGYSLTIIFFLATCLSAFFSTALDFLPAAVDSFFYSLVGVVIFFGIYLIS